jgi:hypothetical protein
LADFCFFAILNIYLIIEFIKNHHLRRKFRKNIKKTISNGEDTIIGSIIEKADSIKSLRNSMTTILETLIIPLEN